MKLKESNCSELEKEVDKTGNETNNYVTIVMLMNIINPKQGWGCVRWKVCCLLSFYSSPVDTLKVNSSNTTLFIDFFTQVYQSMVW